MSDVTWFFSREKTNRRGGNSYITVTGMLVENTPKRYQNLVLWACPKFISTPKRYQIINNNKLELQILIVMYLSNRSFNMPSPGNPPGIWLFWKLLFKFLPTQAKMPFKCPTLGSIQVIRCPHPGDISQAQKWQKGGGNAFSCRTKSLKYNKNWETCTVSVFTTNKSLVQSGGNRCYKVTECSAFLRHATYKAFYKKRSHLLRLLHHDHFTDMHHRSPY